MNRIIFILPFVLFVLGLKAQDPQFTQVYATPLYTCPAFAGSTIGSRFSLNMRDQWPAIPGSYVTMAASLDHYIHELNSGVGLMLLRDRAGSGRLGTTSISLLYTYDARITKLIHVRPAIQFTYGQRSIDFMKLRFNDQLYYEMESSTEIPSYESVSYPDFGTGLMVYTETYWGGFSLDHMTQPNISLIDGVSLLPRKFTLFGGYKHLISGKLGNHNEESLTGGFLFKSQGKFDQLDFGCYWFKKPLVVGCWYRGIPIFKAYKRGYQNNDAIALMVGYQLEKMKFGFSYDFTISRLVLNTAGSIEASLSYEFNQTLRRKRKAVIIPCPKF